MSQAAKSKWNDRHNIPKPTSGLGKTDTDAAANQQQNGQTVSGPAGATAAATASRISSRPSGTSTAT